LMLCSTTSDLPARQAGDIHVRHIDNGEPSPMIDFARAREFMLDNQLRTSGITDWRILAQMSEVPREDFVAPSRREIAYIDEVQWFGAPGTSRFMSSPATFAKLVQLGDIGENDTVLDIGAGTGYSTAVIAGLCQSVVGLESDPALAATAVANLARLNIRNASIVGGDTSRLGVREFDVIMVEGALESVPEEYLALMKDGGRLVALIRQGPVAAAHLYVKTAGSIAGRSEFNAQLPLLVAAQPEEEFVF
jgi:protein-L-isoaspartate(D-aspartate) O-methyltransferase